MRNTQVDLYMGTVRSYEYTEPKDSYQLEEQKVKLLDFIRKTYSEEFNPPKKRHFTGGIIAMDIARNGYNRTFARKKWLTFLETVCKHYHKHVEKYSKAFWYMHFDHEVRSAVADVLLSEMEDAFKLSGFIK